MEYEIVRFLVLLVRRSGALIAWACSPSYRARKDAEWKLKPARKYLDLGFSGACLTALVALGMGVAMLVHYEKAKEARRANAKGETRFSLEMSGQGTNKSFTVLLNKGGMSNIMGSRDLNDLKKRVKENITVVGGRTNELTNLAVRVEFSHIEK